jgi:flagellar protein FliS
MMIDDPARKGYLEARQEAVSAQLDSPVRIILTLFNEALAAMARAQVSLRSTDRPAFKDHVARAMTIIEGLRLHLDYERGGEVAISLGRVYDCVVARLLEAHRRRDAVLLAEAIELLEVVRDAWRELLPTQQG